MSFGDRRGGLGARRVEDADDSEMYQVAFVILAELGRLGLRTGRFEDGRIERSGRDGDRAQRIRSEMIHLRGDGSATLGREGHDVIAE